MSDSRDDGVLALVVIGAVVGAIAWVVWSFSEALGLDMATGGRVFGLLVMAAGFLAIAWWTSGFGLLGFRGSWPIALGLVWMAFWPALTVWGALTPAFMGVEPEVAWWAAWYTKGVVLVLLVGGGWWLNSYLEDRY